MPTMQVMILEDTTTLVLIHLAFKRPGQEYERDGNVLKGKDSWGIACCPNIVTLHETFETGPARQRSDDPRAVTCPSCKMTDIYKQALRRVETMGRAVY